jgi:5-methylcytosine-specific restriction endonuclease McrA
MIVTFKESCSLCGRVIPSKDYLEKHHLTPRSKGGKETAPVCIDCGNQVHQLFTNNELRDKYNSIEALREDHRIQKWISWIRKRSFGVCHKEKKKR